MKRIYFLVVLVLALLQVSAQPSVPYGFNYQSIARDALGVPIVNSSVKLRISIIEANIGGTIVYQETQTSTTNQFGLLNLVIGQGLNTSGGSLPSFASIDWASNNYFVLVEVDKSGSWISLGISQFQSVPFALAADNALKIQNQKVSQILPSAGQYLRFNAVSGQWEASNLIGANGGTVVSVSGISPIVINGNVGLDPQISIQQSGSGVDGYLSGIDWATFNSKIGPTTLATGDLTGPFSSLTVTALNGNPIVSTVPTNGQILVWNGVLGQWEPSNAPVGSVTTVTGTGPISVANGGSSPVISISQADNVTDGFITQADYVSFSNKLSTSTGFAGDISGTNSLISVDKIRNTPVNLTGLTSGQILSFDGTSFIPAYIPVSSSFLTSSTNSVTISGLNFEIGTASGTSFGLLDPADWLNFNNKLSQPVSIVGVSGTSVSGTYPAFTISGGNNAWLLGGNTVGAVQNIGTADNFDLPFITNGVEAMRITNGGDVLINTTSTLAGARLEIREPASTTRPSVAVMGGAGNSASIVLGRASIDGGIGVAGASAFFSNLANPGDLIVRATGVNNNLILSAKSTGDIIFATGLVDTPKMTLSNAGILSIVGTAIAGNLKINNLSNGILSVDGLGNVITTSISISPSQWLNTFTGFNSGINYTNSFVGIGNQVPSFANDANLYINSGGNATMFLEGTNPTINFSSSSNDAAIFTDGADNNKLKFTTGFTIDNYAQRVANTRLTIDPIGNVGIGTTTPVNLLHVASSASGVAAFITSSNADNSNFVNLYSGRTAANFGGIGFKNTGALTFGTLTSPNNEASYIELGRFTSGGNFGLGTTNPGQRLTVQGNSSVSGIGYFSSISGMALNGAPSGSIVTVDGFGTLGFGSLPQTNAINWTSTTGGITFSNDNIAIGTTTGGGAKLKVNGDISGSGQVIASSTMMPTGTAASTFSLIYKQRIYIPNGTSTINGSINTYTYLTGGVGKIRIKIGSITTDISASTNDPNAFEPIPDIDVTTLAGSYQTVEILGQADNLAVGIMVQSFLLTSHN